MQGSWGGNIYWAASWRWLEAEMIANMGWSKICKIVRQLETYVWLLSWICSLVFTSLVPQVPSKLLYPVSLLSGCWNRWSSQKPNYQYRDHLVGQLTTKFPKWVGEPDLVNQKQEQEEREIAAASPEFSFTWGRQRWKLCGDSQITLFNR